MSPFWLVLIVPIALAIGFCLAFVLRLWDRPDDAADFYGSPEDPFRQFLE